MPHPILETRNLTKVYGQNVIFKDINLKVDEGERIVIIGPSGTGKSTLLRCINMLTAHDGGRFSWMEKRSRQKALTKMKRANKSAWSSRTSCSSTI